MRQLWEKMQHQAGKGKREQRALPTFHLPNLSPDMNYNLRSCHTPAATVERVKQARTPH